MNVYTKKQFWKYFLGIFALLIIGASFWYTSFLATKIEREERLKLTLWAEAIQKKAKLVKYTAKLFSELSEEERKKVELWAEATKKLASDNEIVDYTFVLKVVANNTTVPVILTDENNKVISHRNLEIENPSQADLAKEINEINAINPPIEISIYGNKKNLLYFKSSRLFAELKHTMEDMIKSFISEIVINSAAVPVLFMDNELETVISYGNLNEEQINTKESLKLTIAEMAAQNDPIEIDLGANKKNYIYFKDSDLLTHLTIYPFVQFGIIGLFILVSYWLFSVARKSEQNQVWVGMAKETAHQLGTPLSSLLAWIEILKGENTNESYVAEMQKDVKRLEVITDRFSKIGSEPVLENKNIEQELLDSINYLKSRVSNKVIFTLNSESKELYAKVNSALFSWVLENLIKNAVDAMKGEGSITIDITDQIQTIYIDITDTGKGISKSNMNRVFEPGFTSKKRGWGLGLSLTKRIIEGYHNGKIFVKDSQINKGTIFRIVLNK
jgi:two-component system, sporulation sensor kinase D